MIRLATLALVLPGVAVAGAATVVDAEASRSGDLWRFEVTVAHADGGWDHYADAWEVRAPDGTVLGVRELLHPHESEQPFTRALTGVAVPPEVGEVEIRARDTLHGWGRPFTLPLPQ